MSGRKIPHYAIGTPQQEFFSHELRGFILRCQAQGLDAAEAASAAACMAAYIGVAYIRPEYVGVVIEDLGQVIVQKASQAVDEVAVDREAGRLPPWPETF